MACRGLMMSGIEDVLLITTAGGMRILFGHQRLSRRGWGRRPRISRGPSTHMDETDVIFGGEESSLAPSTKRSSAMHPRPSPSARRPVGLIGA